jgi:hypothetical protein
MIFTVHLMLDFEGYLSSSSMPSYLLFDRQKEITPPVYYPQLTPVNLEIN